jgi:dihydrofolate reductase
MGVSLIVAMSENRVIGVDNDLPWHLPADLKFFKATTLGKPIIMGRKTFDSIGRALPGRQNIVVTRNNDWSHDGVDVAESVEAAIALAEGADEIMITGGAQIYKQSMDIVDRMYITEVALTIDGHAHFPEFSNDNWYETARESHSAEADKPAYAFVTYERTK